MVASRFALITLSFSLLQFGWSVQSPIPCIYICCLCAWCLYVSLSILPGSWYILKTIYRRLHYVKCMDNVVCNILTFFSFLLIFTSQLIQCRRNKECLPSLTWYLRMNLLLMFWRQLVLVVFVLVHW
jgi:hypothetical protein